MSLLLVDGTDLKQWADRRDAQALLPELLRRLVQATGAGVEHVSFRSGDGVQLGGWDGTVKADMASAFVAAGYSGWEAGCDRAVKGKADGDYDARVRDPLGLDPAKTSFVFVTPRRWRDKAKWVVEKRKAVFWRDVIAYDGDDLAAWLAAAPAVHVWFSVAIGKHPRGAEDLESFCGAWSRVTNPPVTDALLLAGRSDEAKKVQQWAFGKPSALSVQADTEDEALAFVLASLRELTGPERDTFLTRAVVVHDEPTWSQLAANKTPLVLIPKFQDRSRTAAAATQGHHVVLGLVRNEPTQPDTVELPRPRRAAAAAALQTMGLAKEGAEEIAPLARAGLGALRRKLAISAAGLTPAWAGDQQRDILPALLVGRWDERSVGDCAIVAALARRDYNEYRVVLEDLSRTPDPPVRRLGTVWMISAKDDAWSLVHRVVTERDLETFEDLALRVLEELNPKFELPPDRQWMAALNGKVPKYSGALREGVADTIALLGANSDIFRLATTRTGQDWADRMVRRILEQAVTVQHWASLGSQLRLLAEAAPDIFLDGAERNFRPPSELATQIFTDADGMFAWSPHTELLWALELLAWSPDHLARASLCLAGLASVDPGGKTSNRPLHSLHEIFLPWHPGTAASVKQRIDVLDLLRKEHPNVSWGLLYGLVPTGFGTAMPTPEPKRRDWAPPSKQSVLVVDYNALVQAVMDRVREDVGTSGPRWRTVLESFRNLHEPEFELTIERLAAIATSQIAAADRLEIWNSLRSLISRNREFSDATWALTPERLERLDQLYELMQPVDRLERVAWLFNNAPQPPKCLESDWQKRAAIVEDLQLRAVRELAGKGFDEVLQLAERVQHPRLVGYALGRLTSDRAYELLAQTLGSPKQSWREVAQGLLYGRSSVDGPAWLLELRDRPEWNDWSSSQKAEFFLALPFGAATWADLDREDLAVRDCYWNQVGYFGRGQLSADDRDYAAAEFANHGRLAAAIHFLAMYARGPERAPDPQFALELLERIGREESKEGEVNWGSHAHEIGELLEIAASPSDAPVERIAKLEWLFVRLLQYQRPPKVLHAAMSRAPSLFVDVLKVVYKGRDEQKTREVSENEQLLAGLGHDLLEDWTRLPGLGDDGGIDSAALASWIDEARELATAEDRSAVADIRIGNLLAHAPTDKDGNWPHVAVRDAVERLDSETLERGIVTGIYNRRGMTTRAVGAGGEQERNLADRFHTSAKALATKWPRTARLLKALGDRYIAEARHEDFRAEFEDDQ